MGKIANILLIVLSIIVIAVGGLVIYKYVTRPYIEDTVGQDNIIEEEDKIKMRPKEENILNKLGIKRMN